MRDSRKKCLQRLRPQRGSIPIPYPGERGANPEPWDIYVPGVRCSTPPRVGYDVGDAKHSPGRHFLRMSRKICPMSAQILNDRGGRGEHQQKALLMSRGAPNEPTGGERAHQQHALQRQMSTHRGRESSSAARAPAPHLHPQGARELISRRRSSAKSPTTGVREELNSNRGNELYTHTRGGRGNGT